MYSKFNYYNNNDDRFGLAIPFLVGALAGGVAVDYFNPYRPRPVYYTNVYPYPYPYYY